MRYASRPLTGALTLADAGLLHERFATTHWQAAERLVERSPDTSVDPNALFVDEGDLLTSAGAAAGIDLWLHVVRLDHGAAVAAAAETSDLPVELVAHGAGSCPTLCDMADPLPWLKIRQDAMAAVEARLADLARDKRGERLTRQPVDLLSAVGPFDVTATIRQKWIDQEFYVVDSTLGVGRPQDRHPVKRTGGDFQAQLLTFELPAESRAALHGVDSVHVYCVSDITIKLQQALLNGLKQASSGVLVEQLWQREPRVELEPTSPSFLGDEESFNPEQQLAYAAMTHDGAFFIWGPPGTGKTKVITAAVRAALAKDQTVLIASNTHVAVDNVLLGLISQSTKDPDFDLGAGTAIRLVSDGTREKVSRVVLDHPHLAIDKAAAVLTNQAARLAEIARLEQANSADPARDDLMTAIEQLPDVDLAGLEDARKAVAALLRREELRRDRVELAEQVARGQELQLELVKALADVAVPAEEQALVRESVDQGRLQLRKIGLAQQTLRQEREEAVTSSATLSTELVRAKAERQPWWPRSRTRWQEGIDDLERRQTEAQERVERLDVDAGRLEDRRAAAAEADRLGSAQLQLLELRLQELARRQTDARTSEQRLTVLRDSLETHDAELERCSRQISAVPMADQLLVRAQEAGWLEQLDRVGKLNEAVERLNAEAEEIRTRRETVQDDLDAKTRDLFATAPVVASTLAGITQHAVLRNRKFDVVVLDEVASVAPPYVVYAASRARRTVALVGDFLQNAPVAEPPSTTTAEEEALADWRKDIFALAGGITDRETAQEHGRCVALRKQYRYPSIVADIVNAFCYEGLLDSELESRPEDGPTVTWVDTSKRPDKTLQRVDGGSWHSNLGLRILEALVRDPGCQRGIDRVHLHLPPPGGSSHEPRSLPEARRRVRHVAPAAGSRVRHRHRRPDAGRVAPAVGGRGRHPR